MTTLWQFFINDIPVEEPSGFDAIELTIQRDPQFYGMQNMFSDNITFPAGSVGSELIQAEYDLNGIDGSLEFVINYSCDGGVTYTNFLTGILNCFFYSKINNEVTVKIEPSDFQRLFKNRLSLDVNINSNVSVDGLPMSDIEPFDLGLHSKKFLKQTLINEAGIYEENFEPVPTNDTLFAEIPFNTLQYDEITGFETSFAPYVSSLANFGDGPSPLYTNNTDSSVTIDISYNLIGTITDFMGRARTYTLALTYRKGSGGFLANTGITFKNYGAKAPGSSATMSQDVNENGTFTFTFAPGESLYLCIVFANYDNDAVTPRTATIGVDFPTCEITASVLSVANPSDCKAFLIHEVFAKICESITGVQDCFISNFFGRMDSEPRQYEGNGCGGWTAITNGLNIRKMKDKESNLFPIVTTFNDLFDSANAQWCLGMQFETIGGKEYIRVEPREYFYNASGVLTILQIADLKTSAAQDLIYNGLKTGYNKWNLNITGSNAIDEFNSTRSYYIPVQRANKQYQAISKYIGSGYLIEQTRRIQYESNPSNDFETDNDLFFICTNREEIISDLYTTPPVDTSYEAGTVSERDENFSDIENVISPETCYNLRISPARMALNHYKWVAGSIWKNPTDPINFISGEGNYQESDIMINGCISSAEVSQDQNLLASQLSGDDGIAIFIPEYLEFTFPISENDFFSLLANANKGIQGSCGAVVDFTGFLIDNKYGPTTQGGIMNFKLLHGQCLLGDFNNDFNNDFFTGNC